MSAKIYLLRVKQKLPEFKSPYLDAHRLCAGLLLRNLNFYDRMYMYASRTSLYNPLELRPPLNKKRF